MPTKRDLLAARRDQAVPPGVSNITPHFADRARGAVIVDVEGRELIDFAGGIGTLNVGHCHPRVVEAIKAQADKLIHSCFHVTMYEPYVELAEKLAELTPGRFPKKTALFNSGAEAVENAIKISRHATGRQTVIAFEAGFHGRTLLGMSLTSKVKPYKFGFGPFAPEIYRMPYAYCYRCPIGLTHPECGAACADHLHDFFVNHAAAETAAALIVEPIAGEGGFITPPPEYFPKLKSICEEFGLIFIADEIQTGMGRTGRWFAMEHWGVEPDVTLVAKSLGGGMPISAVVGRSELMDSPQVGGLGSTYGGNPVSCAAALAVLRVMTEEDLLDRGRALGRTLRQRLDTWQDDFEIIGQVRGLGPMLGLELVRDRATKEPADAETRELVRFGYENGLLLLPCGNYNNVIRLLMPLVITDEQLERGLSIMEAGLKAIRPS